MREIEKDLTAMKDTSELMLDLAYSALLYHNTDLAREVVELEEKTDELYDSILNRTLEKAVKDEGSKRGLVYMKMADSIERIADAALDIADVVLRDIELHPVLKKSLKESDAVILRKKVSPRSKLAGTTLGESKLASETGMWVIAVKSKDGWIYGPDENTNIKAGDIIFTRGPEESERTLDKWVSH